ncbi:Protein phosphatase 2A regulatory subunit A [Handroanthus impetiginosus]|uniref:Protein phosphatase 2A regulatory subunit A n=1 Tax=Handroanthus impetiginosus TaxID=429701 RepID=A0A2G9G3M9_9LAMI|nr:Protein phosphatase 2A regulatory subunit A [Handroanthus impetiginosus]
MDVERSSLCNCVVNFLLEENYLLSAFELLHELLEDGRDDQAIRLKEFFSDPAHFPPDQISRFNSLRVADPQSLYEEKELLEEKLAVREYELRLAQEDILNLKADLLKKSETNLDESSGPNSNSTAHNGSIIQPIKRDLSSSDLGPLKINERLDINCAVKEYLLLAGYRLTAMTFYEEVTDQNLDVWQNSSACVPDALRHYYYQYLSSTAEGAEEKIAMLRENESLRKENDRLKNNRQSLLKSKEMSDAQVMALTKSMELLQKDIKEKENLVQDLKKRLESQRKELNDCRAEITSLKMHIEGALSGKIVLTTDSTLTQSVPESHNRDIELLQNEVEMSKAKTSVNEEPVEPVKGEEGKEGGADEVEEAQVNDNASSTVASLADLVTKDTDIKGMQGSDDITSISEKVPEELLTSSVESGLVGNGENLFKDSGKTSPETDNLIIKSGNLDTEPNAEKRGLGTIQILSDALPKIVPYVLINHREELLPLIMCAIERHPDSATRDSLTHTLFNLIKRPDEQQRRIIMDACVTLAKNVGELRTETELLPQCWEQINHMYEERRLLVAQSCGELAEYVRPEIRDSLILSIVQQLIEDSATVVREAAAHNLALLLALFPNTDKYFKVEEMMFQLVCDPSGVVVETTIKDLVPALIKWGNKLDHILQVLLSHILGSAQRCPPLSGVEGSIESHLRVLGERERWNIDVLLRLLAEMLSYVHQKAVETCPFSSVLDSTRVAFTLSLLELYAGGDVEWPAFEWLHIECFPTLIQLSSLLPQKEDSLRNRLTKFLLVVAEHFGEPYSTHIMLPVFLVAIGNDADLKFFPFKVQSKLRSLGPQSAVAHRLATMCVLPLLLAGILGHPSKREHLTEYLRNLLVQSSGKDHQSAKNEIFNSIRFTCTFEENHNIIFNILWEMVANSDVNLKTSAANLLKVIVPYIDAKDATAHVLPALVTLGSDQNLKVKYASIDAFGAVAQHFKNDMIVDKIRVQMDAFLEDGSHEATIAVLRALLVAVPHTTDRLRDYLMSKIFQFTSSPPPSSDITRRRERANAFCESIRALDATDLSASSVRDFLLPAIQNLLKDTDALDPAHKEALEIILKERSGGTFDAISKVMGAHLGLASSVSSFFGESGLLGKKETGDPAVSSPEAIEAPKIVPQPPAEDTRFRRIMRVGFSDMLRGRTKSSEEIHPSE